MVTFSPQLLASLDAGIENSHISPVAIVVLLCVPDIVVTVPSTSVIGLLTIGMIWSPFIRVYRSPRRPCFHTFVSTTVLALSTNTGVAVLALVPRYLVVIWSTVFGI